MAMTIFRTQEGSETWDSNGNVKQYEIKYFVISPESKDSAIRAVFDDSPASYSGLSRNSVRFDGFDDDGNAELTVVYEKKGSSFSTTSEDISVSFDCGGGTRHVAMAISQKCLWKKDGVTFRDAKKMIGWNGKTGSDSVISGVDVPFAQPRETYTKTMEVPLSTSKRRTIASLVGCVNSSKWKGWNRGEVMFLGCSYSGTENEKAQVSFNFAIQMNEEGIEIADGVPPIKKEGHVYIWTQQETITKNDAPVADVTAVYAAQVAKYADFSQLGLGK